MTKVVASTTVYIVLLLRFTGDETKANIVKMVLPTLHKVVKRKLFRKQKKFDLLSLVHDINKTNLLAEMAVPIYV